MGREISKNELNQIIELAREIQIPRSRTPSNPFAERMGPILNSPEGKFFLIRLMDVSFRSKNYARISAYVLRLFNSTNAHKLLFNTTESLMVRMYRMVGYKLPSVSIPLMLDQIQKVTKPVVFFVGDEKYKDHYYKRKKHNVKLNVNQIGEALIGEQEAQERINSYIALLNQNEVDYISIKISTIYSQITSVAHDEVIAVLIEKLSILYREVQLIEEKTGVTKFVNLDMEEYRDLSMTLDTFMQTLSLHEFKHLRAGIVLQAYLPDAYDQLLRLKKWAILRVKEGGAPIKVRIVKGANMEMEKTESSMEDWPLATFSTKVDTDANFKKMILAIMSEEAASAVNLGIASHNIFDLAFALHYTKTLGLEKYIDFEMLEGMAKATMIELNKKGVNLLLYTPIVKKENYNSAIAYLVRRLDEGTQEGNFLKEGFKLKYGSDRWKMLEREFIKSIEKIPTVKSSPNRVQNRQTQCPAPQQKFVNIANTDWTLEANREWIKKIRLQWAQPTKMIGVQIPVASVVTFKNRELIKQTNWNGELPWEYEIATKEDYQEMINTSSDWYSYSVQQRADILRKSAYEIEKTRGDLIGVAVTELGKIVSELDVEISEAIDFANYYAQNIIDLEADGVQYQSEGINLVLSPWNFPIAIPIGGVFASLAAGKRVILKPSQNAAATAYIISSCLWRAGVPKDAFSFLPAKESTLDEFLSVGNIFDAVILTGGTDTADFLLKRNPYLNLYAETGGKNATIVTALSDRDQAVANVVQSAFGNTGQKCSATSLLILEREVYDDPKFKELLKDCTLSKEVGSPWEFNTKIGPLAVPISDKIQHVLDNTEDSEWLVKPVLKGRFFLSPGIKWGITAKDFEYNNELFGPILCVMRAEGLHDAIELVNNLKFGLTSGIESLAREEVRYWQKKIQAGNIYANRSTTGAIVMRQPFGGIKASCYGFGMKAGGSNYVKQFVTPVSPGYDLDAIKQDYHENYLNHFSKELDLAQIRGQHNITKYIKPTMIKVLVDASTSMEHMQMVQNIADVLKVKIKYYSLTIVNVPADKELKIIKSYSAAIENVKYGTVIRSLLPEVDVETLDAALQKNLHIFDRTPSEYGSFEFLNYLTEQSASINYHRYGNLMGETNIAN